MPTINAYEHPATQEWVQYDGTNESEVTNYFISVDLGITRVIGHVDSTQQLVIQRQTAPPAYVVLSPEQWIGFDNATGWFKLYSDEEFQATHTAVT